MSANSEQWSARPTKQYFANFQMEGMRAFLLSSTPVIATLSSFESYLNPKPGSRNLEFDPQKTVKVR